MSERIQRREADVRDERLSEASEAHLLAEHAEAAAQPVAARGWKARVNAKLAAARLAEVVRRADARVEGEQLGEEP